MLNFKWGLVMALAVALVQPAISQNVVFVDADAQGSATGTSWADAYPDLQVAFLAAGSADYWVAEGVYKPGTSRFLSFTIPSGAKVFGGFDGSEATVDERDYQANVTTLSGDLVGNDVFYLGNIFDNSQHVVRMFNSAAGTTIDGLTIEGGNSFGASPNRGGGLDVFGGSPTINNCVFRYNVGRTGAAVSVTAGANTTFNNCTFDRNEARYGKGAGINVDGASTLSVQSCRFDTNHATGGTYLGAGAGINAEAGTTLVVAKSVFLANITNFGCCGGLEPCLGGAIRSLGTADIDACRFLGNKAHNGGALFLEGTATVDNCEFSGNYALNELGHGGFGGGACVKGGSNTSLRCCTFYANLATGETGGVFVDGAGQISIDTSIFWANIDTQGSGSQSQVQGAVVSHSCVQNLLVPNPGFPVPNAADFPESFDTDPLFVNAKGPDFFAGNENDDLRLLAQSPCIDAGDSATASGLDNTGANRFIDGDLNGVSRLDMGAHEYSSVSFSVTSEPAPNGVSYTGILTSKPGMALYVFVGTAHAEQSFVPYGGVWWDIEDSFAFALVGFGPEVSTTAVFPHPSVPQNVVFQALALNAAGLGNFSNPEFFIHE